MRTHRRFQAARAGALTLLLALGFSPLAAQQRTLTFTDLMQVRKIQQPSISPDGRWVAFAARPDRGDPEVIVRSTRGDTPRYTVSPGSNPVFSADGRWVAVRIDPTLEERETLPRKEQPDRAMALLETATGTVVHVDGVTSFAFSGDGRWLAYLRTESDDAEEPEGGEGAAEAAQGAESRGGGARGSAAEDDDRTYGTPLVLRRLDTGEEGVIEDVRAYVFDEGSRLAYWVAGENADNDGLYVRDLDSGEALRADDRTRGHYTELTWSEDGSGLAFLASTEGEDGEPGPADVLVWRDGTARTLVTADDAPDGWTIPADNGLAWSEDGNRLFFGWHPLRPDEMEDDEAADEDPADEPFDPYSVEDILADRGVDVWHWRDPMIMPQQKVMWPRLKNRTFRAVHHLDRDATVALGSPDLPDVRVPDNASVALATTDVPYLVERTWVGGQSDVYVVDLSTGARTLVAERLRSRPDLSPEGRYVVYYDGGVYYLHDVAAGTTRDISSGLGVPIANEDHDYPNPAPGYGVAGWVEGDAAVLLYDKYDIWVIPTDGGEAYSLTAQAGRPEHRIFRIVDTDPDTDALPARGEVLLSSYHDLNKGFGFYQARMGRPGVEPLVEADKRFRYLAQAEDADRVLFTREDYDEFPDLWVAKTDFSDARKVTDVNPQIRDFAWGTSELVEWQSLDGIPMQGVVIKPNDYDPAKRYPVLVYYYRFFSQRLHEFNDPAVNHRPSFPIYASDGYVVFLPDVRFEVGRPGLASMKSVVPGVQHLIDIGLADPDAIALHGHSWSGYQTAFMVTQTDLFTTAIAGAPVANMTSAYSGIRLGSGLARQFQYEQGQSRLSGSLWDARDEYIDNSPVFSADRINTPMLILHGDEDDAVPWEQSIELYLALRRLGKEAVFLQYNHEPHHPQTYANKLDWAMKMKEWVDHYLKGKPAPAWITEGVPYTGN